MYLAMNRFRVIRDRAAAFEAMWLGRESELPGVPGFVEFRLLRGPEREDHVLYSSHTLWRDEAAFLDWTRSEAFRRAHAGAGAVSSEAMTLGRPEFEGFTTLQRIASAPA
jgi:heme-degrading monooxygenase HmoA